MKTRIIIYLTLITAFFLFAGDLITWSKTYTSDWELEEEAYDVEQTSDGGYIVAGQKLERTLMGEEVFVEHAWIIKLNDRGDTTWTTNYYYNIQNSTPLWDEYYEKPSYAYDIEQTSDGGYIFCGSCVVDFTDSTGDYEKCMSIVKLDKTGAIEWDKIYLEGKFNFAYSIKETKEGNYVVGGIIGIQGDSIFHDLTAKIMKINNIGDTLWTRNFQYSDIYPSLGFRVTWLSKICLNSSNDIFGAGDIYKNESTNGWLVKIDENGNIIWSKDFGGIEGESFSDIQLTNDNCLILTGNQFIRDVEAGGAWLYKVSNDGDSIWSKTIHSGVYDCHDYGKSIQQTFDGGYIIGVKTNQSGMYEDDWWIIKTDAHGDTLWTKLYGSDWDDQINSIKQTNDGGYVVCGNTEGDYLINGNMDYTDFWVLKLDDEGNYTSIDNEQLTIDNYELDQNYPNPFNNQTNISYGLKDISEVNITVYNSNGQLVQNLVNEKQGKGKYSVLFNANKFNSGIYYYQLKVDGKVKDTKKMLYLQ